MNLKNTLKFIKLNEPGIRMLAVFMVIVLCGEIVIKLSQTKVNNIPIKDISNEIIQNVHTVKRGENLWQIATQYFGDGFKWKDIADANNLDNTGDIEEGQKLIIPSVTTLPTPSDLNNPNNTSSIKTEAKTYKITKGDTLWSIAEMEYGSGYNWVDIASANNISNYNHLVEGQELFIPNVNPKISTHTQINDQKAIEDDSYTVQKGDNLWNIAVRAYGDGYKWTEIAKVNSIYNPGLIYPDQKLTLPR
jgi:nucleoid-associated protein YgaU